MTLSVTTSAIPNRNDLALAKEDDSRSSQMQARLKKIADDWNVFSHKSPVLATNMLRFFKNALYTARIDSVITNAGEDNISYTALKITLPVVDCEQDINPFEDLGIDVCFNSDEYNLQNEAEFYAEEFFANFYGVTDEFTEFMLVKAAYDKSNNEVISWIIPKVE